MVNGLLEIVQMLIGTPQRGARPADRLGALHALLQHLDREMPQVIGESLFEAGAALSSDVAMLMEVQSNALFIAYSTDPSLLEKTIPWMHAVQSGPVHFTQRTLGAMELRDAAACRLTPGNREWLLVFGSRSRAVDRALFDEYEDRLCDLFTALVRKRDGDAAQRSSVDHLTGLPDRWATMRRISEALAAAQRSDGRAAMLFIDVNGFKQVNDTLGHGQGDRVLRSIATTMRDALRNNEFVGRIGGDEFAVVLSPVRGVEDAERVAQRLYAGALENSDTHDMPISLGIGIALYPDHAKDQEEWLHHADLAMYRAKRSRRSYCVYDGSCGPERERRPGEPEPRLREPERQREPERPSAPPAPPPQPPPLRGDRGYEQQFLLCFQPIFDVQTGRVTAAEALVRWLHPQDGLLSAESAIAAAGPQEHLQLDLWVARRALMYAKEWSAHGIERVHVNFGAYGEETYRDLMREISASGADPKTLAIELQKIPAASELETYGRFVEGITATGAIAGIENFGGSSIDIGALERLPIRFVKLSRMLLPSAGVNGRSIEAIVALANVMKWDVIATRVASSDDRRLIRNAGIAYMQGFAFAQPMTAIDFQTWVQGSPFSDIVV